METHVHSPPVPVGSAVAFAPHEAEKYHEFFRAGVRRSVVLLGEPFEMWTHYVNRSQRKLCTAHSGMCLLCDKSQADPDVGRRQLDYLFASFVCAARERLFHQRVSVLPRAAGERVIELCAESSYRTRLLIVERGKSNRLTVRAEAFPVGFPVSWPAPFAVEPFVRARFGLRPDPAKPVLLLPPIECEETPRVIGERPKPVAINFADTLSLEDAAAMLPRYREFGMVRMAQMCERVLGLQPGEPLAASSDPAPVPPPVTESVKAKPPVRLHRPQPDGPATLADVIGNKFNEQCLTKGTGEIVCDEVGDKLPAGHPAKPGKPAPQRKGAV